MQFQKRLLSCSKKTILRGEVKVPIFFITLFLCSVLLYPVYEKKVQHIRIVCKDGCIITTSRKRSSIKQHRFDIALKNNKLHFNNKPCSFNACVIQSNQGALYCNGLLFECPVQITKANDGKHIALKAVQKKTQSAHLQKKHASIQQFDKVRVLLDTIRLSDAKAIIIHSTGSSVVISDGRGSFRRFIKKPSVVIQAKKNMLYADGRRFKEKQLKISTQGHLTYGDKTYSGSMYVVKDDDNIMVINEVPLEEYICSVLRTESWPGWPLEVNKVFAITSRTYVISMMQEALKTKRSYHVHNCNRHQTYSGVHDKKILQDAVEQTKGVILTYENKPVIAMFDSCCGGVIPAHVHDVNFDDAPYLARNYACQHCKRCWIYNWKAEYTLDELHKHLFQLVGPVSNIKNMKIAKRDKAGLVQEVLILARKKISIDGKKLYNMLKGVKSFCYTIKKQKNKIILNGRGYGHHLGLCQWGAREMVRDGWDYKRILNFYYPDTAFMKFS